MNYSQVVDNLLRQHTGGQRFFTEMDRYTKTHLNQFLFLVHKVEKRYPNNPLVLTGEFGRLVGMGLNRNRIILSGGLRHKEVHQILKLDCPFVFVDDSFCSGKTLKAVEVMVGQRCLEAFVVYDGSKVKLPNLHSLFRYYDHHQPVTI